MKNLLLTTAFIAMTATAAVAADGSNFNIGLYGGVAVGASENTTNLTTTAGGAGTAQKKTDLGETGGTVGLIAAYDHVMSSGAVWGVDVFGSWHSNEAKQDVTLAAFSWNTKAELKYSFGTALKFGYMVNKTMVFGRVGYINSRFEHTITFAPTVNPTSSKKENLSGLLLGLGVDVPLGEKLAIGLSYDFAIYQKKSNSFSPTNTTATTVSSKFDPRMHFMNVALKYKF